MSKRPERLKDAEISPDHIEWSRNIFQTLREGGIWAVPRSGLVFQKREGKFFLVQRMPWDESYPIPREEMRNFQTHDLRLISRYMRAAGVLVEDETLYKGVDDGDAPN